MFASMSKNTKYTHFTHFATNTVLLLFIYRSLDNLDKQNQTLVPLQRTKIYEHKDHKIKNEDPSYPSEDCLDTMSTGEKKVSLVKHMVNTVSY